MAAGGVVGAVERVEIGEAAVYEVVPAGGPVAREEEVIQIGAQIAAILGRIAVVIAQGGEERNLVENRFVGLKELGAPIAILRPAVLHEIAEIDVGVNVIPHGEDETHGIRSLGALADLGRHGLGNAALPTARVTE